MTGNTNEKQQAGLFARRYQRALQQHLKSTSRAKPAAARKLGPEAVQSGLGVLDLAAIHEQALTELTPASDPPRTQRVVRRATRFFSEAIVPIEATHQTAIANNATLLRLNRQLKQRTQEVATAHDKLDAEIASRQVFEQELRKSESESGRLLRQSRDLQEDLRHLSRQILTTQEEERKRISRELHDLVAQTLTAINIHLASLRTESAQHARGMKRDILRTQRLVTRSVNKVSRFARELRPAVLDDLGLIPALRSLVEQIAQASDLHIHLQACTQVETLNNDQRTVLYRVTQEALTNVLRHAHATSVTVQITALQGAICMQITDNGQSFDTEHVQRASMHKRMGLLGMRERVEMVGGSFTIESAPGQGTRVIARIPLRNAARKARCA